MSGAPVSGGAAAALPLVDAHGYRHIYASADPGAPLAALTVVALHGTGGDERDLVPFVRRVAPGAAVLSPRGPVLEHGMPRFFRRLAEGVFDQEDLTRRTAEFAAFLDAAAAAYGRDRARVVAVGFSNGANLAASLLLRRPGALAGAALLRPMVPFEPAEATTSAGSARVLVAAGRADPVVPAGQPERLAALLTAAGCAVDLRWTAAEHGLVRDDVTWTGALVAAVGGAAG